MDSGKIERRFYRELANEGSKRFSANDIHQRMAAYRTRPHQFAYRFLGSQWWSAQEEIGLALTRHRRVVVRSGNGVGKTYLAADLALWFLYTHSPSIVITTAPNARQVRHVLWHEIRRRWLNANSPSFGGRGASGGR